MNKEYVFYNVSTNKLMFYQYDWARLLLESIGAFNEIGIIYLGEL